MAFGPTGLLEFQRTSNNPTFMVTFGEVTFKVNGYTITNMEESPDLRVKSISTIYEPGACLIAKDQHWSIRYSGQL